jgi:hypothetical protein
MTFTEGCSAGRSQHLTFEFAGFAMSEPVVNYRSIDQPDKL